MYCMYVAVTDPVIPLADSSAAASHVAQREISRESRRRQTADSYSYSSSSPTHHYGVTAARTWLPLACIAVVHAIVIRCSVPASWQLRT